MKVKGTLLLDYVRMIRSVKDRDWSKYLTKEDLEIIDSKILPSQWYPYETLQRIGIAIFKELAGSDLNMVRTFGKFMSNSFAEVYKNTIVAGDPVSSVEKITNLQQVFFQNVNGAGDIKEKGDKWFILDMLVDFSVTGPEAGEAVGYQTAGMLEGIIEHTGGKNVLTDIKRKDDGFEIKFSWD